MTKEEIMNELEGLKKEYVEKMDNIHDVFDNMNDSDKIAIIMDYCNENGYERPEYMDSFDELMTGLTPTEIVDRIGDGFSTNNEYFWADGYGNLQSGDAYDTINEFDDVDDDFLKENRENYNGFDDFNSELCELSDKYDELIDELEEMGEDVSDIGAIED